MNVLLRLSLVVLLGLTALAAEPASKVDDLVRRGNVAFADREYARAVRLYQQAEMTTTDPGLVAFNKATAYLRLAKTEKSDLERQRLFQLAEAHYRRCLADAEGLRRARALLGRGNSLVHSGRANDEALGEAVRSYRESLRLAEGEDDELAADARHNLEVAKALWLKQLAAAKKAPPPEDESHDTASGTKNETPRKPDGSGDPMQNPGDANGGDPRPAPGKPMNQQRDGKKPVKADVRSPNSGDRTHANAEQHREQAEVDLEDAVERIILKRRASRGSRYTDPNGSVKDW